MLKMHSKQIEAKLSDPAAINTRIRNNCAIMKWILVSNIVEQLILG